MSSVQKTLGEILCDAVLNEHAAHDQLSSEKAKFEAVANVVQMEVLSRAQIDQVLFEKKFHAAMELAKTHMGFAAVIAKQLDAVNELAREFGYGQGELDADLVGCLRKSIDELRNTKKKSEVVEDFEAA